MLCCMDYLWFLTFSATFRFFREIMYLLCSIFTFWIYPLNQAMWFSVDFTNYFLPQHKRNNRFHGILSKSTVQCTVWKRTSKFDQDKKFREINSLVTSLEKPLISRKNVLQYSSPIPHFNCEIGRGNFSKSKPIYPFHKIFNLA